MLQDKWLYLQLFAGEGAASSGTGEGSAVADGAETGVNAADAARQRLLELGVPAGKLRKRANYTPKQTEEAAVDAQTPKDAQEGRQDAAAQPAEEPQKDPVEQTKRLTWDEIMADPEYNKQMQETMRARLKKANAAEENLGKLMPALEVIARRYDMDPAKLDYAALSDAVNQDAELFEKEAIKRGLDEQTAMKLDRYERDEARRKKEESQTLERQKMQQHFQKLIQQGEALKKTFPKFDLRTEMQNPVFARMTHPNVGLSVEDAYYAVHRTEIQAAAMEATAKQTAQQISNAIRSGSQRPDENGTSSRAPSVTTFDYRAASPKQREAFKKHIRDEAAQGRKVYPGSFPGR